MQIDDTDLDRLLASLDRKPESLLILGAIGKAPARESVVGAFSFEDVTSIDDSLRVDLGVAIGAGPEHISSLARLRDVHCRRVLLLARNGWSNNDLLGLGFQRMQDEKLPAYICDPDLTPLRDWNNASNWAHPQNFDKDRW